MCNCGFVPVMMGCNCNCGGNNNTGGNGTGNTEFKQTVLYDGVINAAGSYNLTDDVNNYDDVWIVHEYNSDLYRQCSAFPVVCLGEDQMVCHAASDTKAFVDFSFVENVLKVRVVIDSYRIVKIIGRKY